MVVGSRVHPHPVLHASSLGEGVLRIVFLLLIFLLMNPTSLQMFTESLVPAMSIRCFRFFPLLINLHVPQISQTKICILRCHYHVPQIYATMLLSQLNYTNIRSKILMFIPRLSFKSLNQKM